MLPISITRSETLKQKPTDESKLGFGRIFTDHMFLMDYELGRGWHDARIVPYANFSLDPATTVFHYGQAIFEGTKCYRRADGGLQLFRPQDNLARMSRSAARMGMPELDEETALEGLRKLVELDQDWVPHQDGTSLYIRPTMIATDVMLGVHAAHHYLFYIILDPVGSYYKDGLKPVGIYVEDEYVRAVRGGTGFTKCAGNYAASILAGAIAEQKGFSQVLWLDGVEQKYVEEVGSMNMMFAYGNKIVTPALNGSILPGITRQSVLTLAGQLGYETVETKLAIADVFADVKSGKLTEAFGTGTAAVISPVGELCWKGENLVIGDGKIGPVAQKLYDTLTGIQYGRVEDKNHWVLKLT
ncbi:MAG: branched-chain amino acid aminotransferase [Bacteroidales bacterium]|nr:branched-chain amino acid aminotransferase [Clostridia bacterium]MBR3653751.1 branched-chain amino acid aminotransferase [Bacteroidales bacterium]MBR4457390.1 branched-chain amino acid aminotransferase [Clostridia bacterium]